MKLAITIIVFEVLLIIAEIIFLKHECKQLGHLSLNVIILILFFALLFPKF
jgi:hypothetical protein